MSNQNKSFAPVVFPGAARNRWMLAALAITPVFVGAQAIDELSSGSWWASAGVAAALFWAYVAVRVLNQRVELHESELVLGRLPRRRIAYSDIASVRGDTADVSWSQSLTLVLRDGSERKIESVADSPARLHDAIRERIAA